MTKPPSDISEGNILIVDDTPNNLRLLAATLSEKGYEVRSAINGKMAIMGAKAQVPDLILLDVNMPDMNGYEVCHELKQDKQTEDIPIIFISALDESIDKVRAFAVGGVDFINKPFQVPEVLARVDSQINILRLKQKLKQQNQHLKQEIAERIAAENQVRTLNSQLEARVKQRTKQLETLIQQLKAALKARKQAQSQLIHMALHDPLTGLVNRTSFLKTLQQALKKTQAKPEYRFAVLFMDCDRFKVVNDSLGHLAGDKLLVKIAQRLGSSLPKSAVLSRFGGDEFTIFIDQIETIEQAATIAQQLLQKIAQPFSIEQRQIFINACIGIVEGNQSYSSAQTLFRDADIAMYQAKRSGSGKFKIFDCTMHTRALAQLEIETDLRRAIERQEFILLYQPIISLHTGQIEGFEALIRWQHPEKGIIPPNSFIPIAEETELIVPIGFWVLQQASQQMKQWQQQYNYLQESTISVNLSAKQFAAPNLIERIDRILKDTSLDSRNLKLEITESVIMDNAEAASLILMQLRERQIQISIDDFGTGYSSLSYLHRFPVNTLKIDRSFIINLHTTNENIEIVRTIVSLAKQLKMTVNAEGIESKEHLEHLRKIGCEFGQGYLFSRPIESEAATQLLEDCPRW